MIRSVGVVGTSSHVKSRQQAPSWTSPAVGSLISTNKRHLSISISCKSSVPQRWVADTCLTFWENTLAILECANVYSPSSRLFWRCAVNTAGANDHIKHMLSIVRAKVTRKFAQLADPESLWPGNEVLAIFYIKVLPETERYAPQVLPTRRPILPSSHEIPRNCLKRFQNGPMLFFGSMQHHLSWRVRLLSEASNNLVPPRLVGKPTPSRTCGKIHIYLQSKSSWGTSSYLHLGTLSCKTAYPTPGLLACNTGTSKERY